MTDFDRVNLRLMDEAGNSQDLINVGDASACGSEPGWHYLRNELGVPVQLSVCPASCDPVLSVSRLPKSR